jgi:alkyl sulfatase BDS1-like metallo-beta-lactamase superfamily hydrolase
MFKRGEAMGSRAQARGGILRFACKIVPAFAVLQFSWSVPGALAKMRATEPKPATEATKAANKKVLESLPFADKEDFENATRGLIAKPETLTIKGAKGNVVWDLEAYKSYIKDGAPAPDTVNPSLWRNAQLSMQYGLFKVADRIYQVRGYDLANATYIQGDTGWIVIDMGGAVETAKAAYDLVSENLGKKPVVAVVYSHSHIDHFGGVRGIVDEADVQTGKVVILAPEHFTEHAVNENVIAGNAMSRRAVYMYGAMLPRNPQGGVNAGLGQTVSSGTTSLILPTREIKQTGEEIVIDGIRMVFQMTPSTEAPAEMNTYFPDLKAMWMAENSTNTLHNILTLRGALVRDPLKWASYLDETLRLYGANVEVKFQSHHWPMWGNAKVVDYWKKHRDLYKYLHDQSVRLMNQGYTGIEISNMVKLPPELDQEFYNRGYYGTVKHNTRAIYQRYMGFYDANPSTLDELPPEEAARKYVEYMGGADAVLAKAKTDFDKGEYRWVAQALKHVVFADPDNKAGKELLADAYEQMGYQAESGPWRSVYLQGAYELRNGTPNLPTGGAGGSDITKAMTPEMLFDYLGVKLNGEKAAGRRIVLNFNLPDIGKHYVLTMENAVLNYAEGETQGADATLTLSKIALDRIQAREITLEQAITAGDLGIDGKRRAVIEFFSLLDDYPYWFNIVTP